jgi:hypothetical protein
LQHVALSEPLSSIDGALSEHFGQVAARASVSFVGVDPIEVLRFEPIPGERAYVSLGMARHPMTAAAESLLSSEGPRAELMLHVSDPSDHFEQVWRRVALLAASPAVEGVVYTPGMTVDLGEPLVSGSSCTGGLVSQSVLASVLTPVGEVQILQILPATPNEIAWSRVHGGAALADCWVAEKADLLDLGRRSVSLS